jgi:hypothetical protein
MNKSTYVCRRCNKGKHHISICESASTSYSRDKDSQGAKEGNEGKVNGEIKDFVGHTGCDQYGILLQTARVEVHPIDDIGTEVCSRVLFDSGSQRSYISEKVRASLQLKTIRTEKVIIKTFGQAGDSRVQRLDVVQFKIKNKSDATHDLKEFKDLEFADYEGDSATLPIGILIGIDYYHAFMTGKVVHSREGPVACGTKVGWVISGKISSGTNSALHRFETHFCVLLLKRERQLIH